MAEDVEGADVDLQRLELPALRAPDPRQALEDVVRAPRHDRPLARPRERVARPTDALHEARGLAGAHVLERVVHGPDVDPELEGRRRDERLQLAGLERGLRLLPGLP